MAVELYLNDNPELKRESLQIHLFNKDFGVLYDELSHLVGQQPSLVYLDQNGVRFIEDKYFIGISSKPQTDFLYYLSSSYFYRFGNTAEFRRIVPKADVEDIKEKPYKYIHNEILNYLRSKLPQNSSVRLYPFTIKKPKGVYGIIFGASHIRAVDKFLRTAWSVNEVNGAANFDIDDDSEKDQLVLFGEQPIKKIDAFKKDLRKEILSGRITNNKEAFDFTIEKGHIGTHAMEEIKEMKKKNLITFAAKSPKVNYEAVYQANDIVQYQIVK